MKIIFPEFFIEKQPVGLKGKITRWDLVLKIKPQKVGGESIACPGSFLGYYDNESRCNVSKESFELMINEIKNSAKIVETLKPL